MKIGLLLGSFDPIHLAHVTMASVVLNSGLCDKVLFVVAKQNPWKKNKAAPFEIRCEMVKAAIHPLMGKCEVCELEKNIEDTSYSYKVLGEIKKEYPNDNLFIIVGTDTITKIHNWRNFNDKIKPYFKFIEIARGSSYAEQLEETQSFKVIIRATEYLGKFNCIIPKVMQTSSTMIREMVKNNMNPYPYVDENVARIINHYKLYK